MLCFNLYVNYKLVDGTFRLCIERNSYLSFFLSELLTNEMKYIAQVLQW